MLNANRDGTNLEDAQSPSENGKPCNTSVTPETKIATESGHWYLGDGTPFYTIKNGDGKERAVTLRDARKVNAVPSVTTITKIIASDGLQKYFDRQMFSATWKRCSLGIAPWEANEQRMDFIFAECQAASREHSKASADKGTALHGAIERWIRGEGVSSEWAEHIGICNATLLQYGIDVLRGDPEKSFAHEMGFGGKVDWHQRAGYHEGLHEDDYSDGIVLDFKSKPSITPGKRYGYDNHAMQLAAYSMGLGMKYARCLNVFVGIEDKRVLIHEWSDDDLARGWNMFSLLLKFWQVSKNYYPLGHSEEANGTLESPMETPTPRNQPLFDHMAQEHGLTLTVSECDDIEHIVARMMADDRSRETEHSASLELRSSDEKL